MKYYETKQNLEELAAPILKELDSFGIKYGTRNNCDVSGIFSITFKSFDIHISQLDYENGYIVDYQYEHKLEIIDPPNSIADMLVLYA